jgi:hypothetical protein
MTIHKVTLNREYMWRINRVVVKPGDMLLYETSNPYGVSITRYVYVVAETIDGSPDFLSVAVLTPRNNIIISHIRYE